MLVGTGNAEDEALEPLDDRWIVVNNSAQLGRTECVAWLQHILLSYNALPELSFFLQGDSDDNEYHDGRDWHSSDIVSKVWNISRASEPPGWIPLSNRPIGSMWLQNQSDLAFSTNMMWAWRGHEHHRTNIYSIDKQVIDVFFPNRTRAQLPRQAFAWKNGLFVVSKQRILGHSFDTYARALNLLLTNNHFCFSLERLWQVIFGGCGFSWLGCNDCPMDCGSCELHWENDNATWIGCA
jgi:hypothetical protein